MITPQRHGLIDVGQCTANQIHQAGPESKSIGPSWRGRPTRSKLNVPLAQVHSDHFVREPHQSDGDTVGCAVVLINHVYFRAQIDSKDPGTSLWGHV